MAEDDVGEGRHYCYDDGEVEEDDEVVAVVC